MTWLVVVKGYQSDARDDNNKHQCECQILPALRWFCRERQKVLSIYLLILIFPIVPTSDGN